MVISISRTHITQRNVNSIQCQSIWSCINGSTRRPVIILPSLNSTKHGHLHVWLWAFCFHHYSISHSVCISNTSNGWVPSPFRTHANRPDTNSWTRPWACPMCLSVFLYWLDMSHSSTHSPKCCQWARQHLHSATEDFAIFIETKRKHN